MDRIRTRDAEGKQRPEYYKFYYQRNKERLAQRFKENYERIKVDPVLRKEHQKRCADATRRYRANHPERVARGHKTVYYNRRRRVFEKLGGAVCVKCGCDVLEFLEINHKNGGGCRQYRIIGNRLLDMLNNGQELVEGYEVLCRVCNALDYLQRKNLEASKHYEISWQNYTGNKALKL